MASAAVKRYWSQVAALGCCICGGPAEIAHAHGGSIVEKMGEPKAKGRKLPRYDWLVLPLCPPHHRGNRGLDIAGGHIWETWHGPQVGHIDRLIQQLGLDVWALAQVGRKGVARDSAQRGLQDGASGRDDASRL